MKEEVNGWIIINIGHPTTGSKFIVNASFRFTRTEAVKYFTEGSGKPWQYWRKKYNFRVVAATQTIEVSKHVL